MPTNARRRSPVVLPCDTLRQLLNDDFARMWRSIYAYAVFAERLRAAGRHRAAAAAERRGKLEVRHAAMLCQVVYDFNGTVVAPTDELNAVLNADRAADPGWAAETVRRLKERARQLRAIGEPGLGRRVARLAAAKLAAPELAAIVGGAKAAAV
jgi:hypothetical protein